MRVTLMFEMLNGNHVRALFGVGFHGPRYRPDSLVKYVFDMFIGDESVILISKNCTATKKNEER